MEKLRNLKEHICSFENLLAAYREAAKDKRYREEVIRFTENLEENLLALRKELLEESYQVGPYREFFVDYPKRRLIMALSFRDRIVQHGIYRQINPYIDKRFLAQSYGCRTGKGTLAAAQKLQSLIREYARKPDARDYRIVKCDISKYFYRVDHRIALGMYGEICEESWFLGLMGKIINSNVPFGLPPGMGIDECPKEARLHEVGMPTGNLTSQETANIYLDKLDRFCKFHLKIKPYVRYMDDFIFIAHKRDTAALLAEIRVFLKDDLALDMNRKTAVLPLLGGCEFVGYQVKPYSLRLRRKTTRHMKAGLTHIAGEYAEGRISLERANATLQSDYGMLKHCTGNEMREWISENFVLKRRESGGEDGKENENFLQNSAPGGWDGGYLLVS